MKQYRSLFRNRNYRMLWLGGVVSTLGDFFNSLALLKILSEDPAHLGFYLAVIMVAKMLPGVLLGPVAGVLADRLNRRTTLITTDVLRAALVTGLVFVDRPAPIVALVFLSAGVSAFFNPAHTALMPSLVGPEELVSATSLSFLTNRTAQLVGNALGAATLLVLSPHQVFYVDAVSFLISALFHLAIRLPASPSASTTSGAESDRSGSILQRFAQDVNEAISFLRESPPVRHFLTAFGICAVGDAGGNVLLFTFVVTGLGLAAERYGFLGAVMGGVTVAGGLIVGALGNRVHWRHLISAGGIGIWVFYFSAVLIHRTLPSLILLATVGLFSGCINVGANTAYGLLVPDHVRGRIASAWGMIQNGIYVLGTLAAGALSDRFGPIPVLLGFTMTYLLTGLYAMRVFRGSQVPAAAATVQSP